MSTFEYLVVILLTLILIANFYFYLSLTKMFTTKSGWLLDLLEGIQDDIRNKQKKLM